VRGTILFVLCLATLITWKCANLCWDLHLRKGMFAVFALIWRREYRDRAQDLNDNDRENPHARTLGPLRWWPGSGSRLQPCACFGCCRRNGRKRVLPERSGGYFARLLKRRIAGVRWSRHSWAVGRSEACEASQEFTNTMAITTYDDTVGFHRDKTPFDHDAPQAAAWKPKPHART
jgi:hypothetical protein